jgi:hypothetical protein
MIIHGEVEVTEYFDNHERILTRLCEGHAFGVLFLFLRTL